eukprot:1061479-Amphidinium_carterae.2
MHLDSVEKIMTAVEIGNGLWCNGFYRRKLNTLSQALTVRVITSRGESLFSWNLEKKLRAETSDILLRESQAFGGIR